MCLHMGNIRLFSRCLPGVAESWRSCVSLVYHNASFSQHLHILQVHQCFPWERVLRWYDAHTRRELCEFFSVSHPNRRRRRRRKVSHHRRRRPTATAAGAVRGGVVSLHRHRRRKVSLRRRPTDSAPGPVAAWVAAWGEAWATAWGSVCAEEEEEVAAEVAVEREEAARAAAELAAVQLPPDP